MDYIVCMMMATWEEGSLQFWEQPKKRKKKKRRQVSHGNPHCEI